MSGNQPQFARTPQHARHQRAALRALREQMDRREHTSFSVSVVAIQVAEDTLTWLLGDADEDDVGYHYMDNDDDLVDARSPFQTFVVEADAKDDVVDVSDEEHRLVDADDFGSVVVEAASTHAAKHLARDAVDVDVLYRQLTADAADN